MAFADASFKKCTAQRKTGGRSMVSLLGSKSVAGEASPRASCFIHHRRNPTREERFDSRETHGRNICPIHLTRLNHLRQTHRTSLAGRKNTTQFIFFFLFIGYQLFASYVNTAFFPACFIDLFHLHSFINVAHKNQLRPSLNCTDPVNVFSSLLPPSMLRQRRTNRRGGDARRRKVSLPFFFFFCKQI